MKTFFKLVVRSFLIFLAIAGIVMHPVYTQSASAYAEVDYDCSGKADGDYPHPTKCDHFIACVAQTHAYEMPCAMGGNGQRLHFVQNSGSAPETSRCDYPEVVQCEARSEEETSFNFDSSKATAISSIPTMGIVGDSQSGSRLQRSRCQL